MKTAPNNVLLRTARPLGPAEMDLLARMREMAAERARALEELGLDHAEEAAAAGAVDVE